MGIHRPVITLCLLTLCYLLGFISAPTVIAGVVPPLQSHVRISLQHSRHIQRGKNVTANALNVTQYGARF